MISRMKRKVLLILCAGIAYIALFLALSRYDLHVSEYLTEREISLIVFAGERFGPAPVYLIPVWLMHCTWENENMLFAVNGQTARVVGDMPHDSGKRALTIFLSVVIGLVLGLFYVFKISGDGFTTTNLIVLAVCCILLPILVDGHFMGQVRTANEKHEADDAVERGSFTITERQG